MNFINFDGEYRLNEEEFLALLRRKDPYKMGWEEKVLDNGNGCFVSPSGRILFSSGKFYFVIKEVCIPIHDIDLTYSGQGFILRTPDIYLKVVP